MFNTLAEVRAANKQAGGKFFSRGNAKFFNSKTESKLVARKYFVTSEQMGENSERRYKIRIVLDNARIKTFATFSTKAEAIKKIKDLQKRNLHSIKDFSKVEVYARRWFRRTFGNTYTAVKVYVDDELVGTNYTLGYGDHYKTMAFHILQNNGYYEKSGKRAVSGKCLDEHGYDYDIMDNKDLFSFHVEGVPREKDLKAWLNY